MFTTPQKSGASTLFNSPKKVPLKGLFSDGIWHCNCTPRLPASHFQVKKEGRNKGRWFYTCQESKENSCGFFLWDEEAKPREASTLINNSRSEPDDVRTPVDASRDKRTVEGHAAASNEWIRNLEKKEEDEFDEWPLSPEEEKKVAAVVERKSVLVGTYPETPRKAVKPSQFDTPGSKRKREDDTLPTPVTGASRIDNHFNAEQDTQDTEDTENTQDTDIFTTPSARPSVGQNAWESSQHSGLRSPSYTPTPSRFRDATEPTERRSDNPKQSYDISDEVMDLLKDQHVDEDTASSLRKLLNKHALKISGIAKGRDITRLALKAKDVKIAELQQKITALEAEREMDKTVIRHFKSDMAESVAKRGRGRGRGKT